MKKHSALFFRTFISYMLILLLGAALLMGLMFYSLRKQRIADREAQCRREAQILADQMDQRLDRLARLSNKLFHLSWVWKYSAVNDVFSEDFSAVSKMDIVTDFQVLAENDTILFDVVLLFPQKDTAVSARGWFPSIHQFLCYAGSNPPELTQILVANHNYQVLSADGFSYRGKPAVWLMNSVGYMTQPQMQTVLIFNTDEMNAWLNRLGGEHPLSLSILDTAGRTLGAAESHDSVTDTVLHLSIPSKSFGWQYQMSYDLSVYSLSDREVFLLLGFSFVAFGIGPLAAMLLTRVSYRPLQRLTQTILAPMAGGVENAGRNNEFHLLEWAFGQLMDENSDMKHRVSEYEGFVQHDLLLQLLKGYFQISGLTRELSYYGIRYTDENQFCVLLIGSMQGKAAHEPMVAKLFENLKTVPVHSQLVQVPGEGIAVVFSDLEGPLDRKILEQFQRFFSAVQGIGAWLGKIEPHIIGISKSYHSALDRRAMEQFPHFCGGSILQQQENFYYPTDWQTQLTNGLKLGKKELTLKILTELQEENERRSLTDSAKRKLFYTLKDTILRAAAELDIEEIVAPSEGTDSWEWLREMCCRICGRFADDLSLGEQICSYIQENYRSPELSLKSISQRFGISVAMSSRVFKASTNVNFSDFVCRLRVERVKELMRAGVLSVRTLCQEVGYENDYSLRRAFQRYEGISLAEYREKLQKKRVPARTSPRG